MLLKKRVQFGKLLKFIIPTYLTSLFNTVYTIIDGIFVSAYVGTNALAAINIVYPIVNVLTGIALVFATGGSAVAALHIGGNRKEEASHAFSVSSVAAVLLSCLVSLIVLTNLSTILSLLGATDVTIAGCKTYALWWLWATPVVIGKELFTYFIRVDGSPAYSFVTALSGGVLNTASPVFPIAVSGMRIYGLGFLFSGINIYAAVRMMAYGKGYFSGLITFLRSFALLLLFLTVLPQKFGLTGVWLAVPAAEVLTLLVAVWFLRPIQR